MTAELGDWFTDLGGSDPATAAAVAGALVAVLESADPAGLAAVSSPATRPSPDPRESADHAYQQLLESLQRIRRRVADVATTRKRLSVRLDERRGAGAGAAEIAELEHELVAAWQGEEVLTEQSQRLQYQVDAFRTAKETAKALYTAAEAQLRIAEAMEAAGGEPVADLAQLTTALMAAQEKLEQVSSQGQATVRPLRQQGEQAGHERREHPVGEPMSTPQPPQPPQPPRQARRLAAEPAPGLLELQADPLGSEIAILFAVEPADTVTLLAVLEDAEAAGEHGEEAIGLASDLLTEIRDEGWPADIDAVMFRDSGEFLARFFPAHSG
jgi:phage shock protein A